MNLIIMTEMNYPTLLLIEAYLISMIYRDLVNGEYSLRSDFKIGAFPDFFVGLSISVVFLSNFQLIDFQESLVDTIWEMVYLSLANCSN